MVPPVEGARTADVAVLLPPRHGRCQEPSGLSAPRPWFGVYRAPEGNARRCQGHVEVVRGYIVCQLTRTLSQTCRNLTPSGASIEPALSVAMTSIADRSADITHRHRSYPAQLAVKIMSHLAVLSWLPSLNCHNLLGINQSLAKSTLGQLSRVAALPAGNSRCSLPCSKICSTPISVRRILVKSCARTYSRISACSRTRWHV